jgi:SAM-dependent methyltransferase
MDIRSYNRQTWDRQVESGQNPWTKPVGRKVINKARQGKWSVLLTEQKPVPRSWFPPLQGLAILALACGGGQQGPIFAAAGAKVTVFDNSPKQLACDRLVAEREKLDIRTVEGDARDLSKFSNESFDLVFNPVSTLFMEDVLPVWKEAYRVLRPGGALLAGLMNPDFYLFDFDKAEQGVLDVIHKIPYADVDDPVERQKMTAKGWPLEFSHSLGDLLGGQLRAGFHLVDLYEDRHCDIIIGEYMPTYIATRAIKPLSPAS